MTYSVVTERLGMTLGPRLLRTADEDFPDKQHENIIELGETILLARWWNDWIDRQNKPKKHAKK